MTIHEPATFATDLALAALTGFLASKLLRRGAAVGSIVVRLWGAAFVASATAALLGGFFHGFGPSMGETARRILWMATLYNGGATGLFLLGAALVSTTAGRLRSTVLVLVIAKAIVYAAWVTGHPDFRWLIYDYGSAMMGVAVLQGVRLRRGLAPGATWILAGIAGSFAAALVQRSGLALHAHFNHNDLYHVLQMGPTWLLYRGGREASEARPRDRLVPQEGAREPLSARARIASSQP